MPRDRVEIVSGGEISPRRPARATDAHEEVTEAVIKPLDVRQHAHGADGAHGERGRPCNSMARAALYDSAVFAAPLSSPFR
jgi:hypothetical protein